MTVTATLGLFLLFLIITLVFGFVKGPSLRTIRHLSKLPGPKCFPVIGNVANVIFASNSDIINGMLNNLEKFGGFYVSWSWGTPICVMANPEDVGVVMKSDNTNKGQDYKSVKDFIGDGLLTSSDEKWKTRRKLLTPCYQYRVGEDGLSNINKHLQAMAARFMGNTGKIVEISSLLRPPLLKIVTELATGIALRDDDEEVSSYYSAMDRTILGLALRILNPYLKIDFVYKRTSLWKKQQCNMSVLHRFIDDITDWKRADLDARLQFGEIGAETRQKNIPALAKLLMLNIQKADIRDEIVTFAFAGHDTATLTLSYLLLELAHHQDIQEKVYEEQMTIFGNDDRDVTFDDLSQMTYTTAVIKETLRLYPPVPMISRVLNNDVTLPGGRLVPASTNVVIPIFQLHRNPKHNVNPSKFDPERFLGQNSSSHPFAYIPFSAGSRNCIGRKFAMVELKAALSIISRRVHIRPVTSRGEMKFLIGFTFQATKPVLVSFSARRKIDN